MRRRRQHLQVSTFPFLAVLLCAMGSLILLLLVIDRRAKVVARARALEAVRKSWAVDEQAAAADRAEWERRRNALHQQLQQEDRQVQDTINSVHGQMETAARDIEVEEGRNQQFMDQIRSEKLRLSRQKEEIAAQVRTAAESKEQSEARRKELARLTAELRKLEQTVEDLKALREQQQQTYSLVPYRGKRGDNRRPLYLECAANGLIFHPDRLTVPLDETSVQQIRAEVEKRLARLHQLVNPQVTTKSPVTTLAGSRSQATGQQGAEEGVPYLLFLIRPNGIVTYYQTLSALSGLTLDFGYEFVEPDWVLNFPENESSSTPQPWMVSDASGTAAGHPRDEKNRAALSRPVHGIPPRLASPGDEYPTRPESAPASSIPAAKGNWARTIKGFKAGSSDEGFAPPGSRGDPEPSSTSSVTNPPSKFAFKARQKGTGSPGTVPDQDAASPGLPGSLTGNDRRESPEPRGDHLPPASAAPSLFSSSDQEASQGHGPRQEGLAPTGLTVESSSLSPGQPGPSPRKNGEPIQTSDGQVPGSLRLSQPISMSGKDGTALPAAPQPTGSRSQSEQNSLADRPEPGMSRGGKPLGLLEPLPQPEAGKKTSSSLPAIRQWLNRDWNIFIECRADGVMIYPGALSIPVAKLAVTGKSGDRPLASAVQQLLARRAHPSLAEGDGERNRTHLCFLVRPNGLRAYYLAYPQLDGLQLPMTRENLDSDEDIAKRMLAH